MDDTPAQNENTFSRASARELTEELAKNQHDLEDLERQIAGEELKLQALKQKYDALLSNNVSCRNDVGKLARVAPRAIVFTSKVFHFSVYFDGKGGFNLPEVDGG